MSVQGGLVAVHYRCARCGTAFGVTTVGRIVGALVGAAVFGFVGIGALSQLGQEGIPVGVAGGLGGVFSLIALAFVVRAALAIRTLARHPVAIG